MLETFFDLRGQCQSNRRQKISVAKRTTVVAVYDIVTLLLHTS